MSSSPLRYNVSEPCQMSKCLSFNYFVFITNMCNIIPVKLSTYGLCMNQVVVTSCLALQPQHILKPCKTAHIGKIHRKGKERDGSEFRT